MRTPCVRAVNRLRAGFLVIYYGGGGEVGHDKIPAMELNHCQSCGHPYVAGDASYCSKCGERLSTKNSLVADIQKIEGESKPYTALHFTSGLLGLFGWLVIIFGWLFAFTAGVVLSETIARTFVSDGASSSILRNMTFLISTIIGVLNTLLGISLIAASQIIEVLLDVRNDLHVTRSYIRFGLYKSLNSETTNSNK